MTPKKSSNGAALSETFQLQKLLESQQKTMECIVQNQLETTKALAINLSIPKHEFHTFDGDPVAYPNFIKNFEVNIEQLVKDDNVKLSYLIQHCTGAAKEAIRSCVILPPERGYTEARKILSTSFGQKHVIVHATIDKVVKGPQIKAYEVDKLQKLARDMKNCHLSSEQMNFHADINSMDTLEKVVRRLPSYLQSDWAKQAGSKPDGEKDSNVRSRQKPSKATTLATHVADTPPINLPSKFASNDVGADDTSMIEANGRRGCLFCSGSHAFEHCRKFTFKPFQERKDFIREHRLCDCCLEARPPHLARNCRSGRICPIVGCGKSHHPLLHLATSNSAYQTSAAPKTFSNSNLKTPTTAQNERHSNVIGSKAQCSATQTNQPRVSLQVIPVRVSGVDGGQEIETYAFLDSGSDSSICLYSLADKLGITGKPVNYTLSTLNAEAD
ncbi:uncharacterized protein LOC144357932 [Saccoglossus kowalevskii]